MIKKPKVIPLFSGLLLTVGLLIPNLISTIVAEEATIAWNPNSETDLDGYSVYWSSGSSEPRYK